MQFVMDKGWFEAMVDETSKQRVNRFICLINTMNALFCWFIYKTKCGERSARSLIEY